MFTVFAQTPVKDFKSGELKDKVSAFIVERAFPGVTRSGPRGNMLSSVFFLVSIICATTCKFASAMDDNFSFLVHHLVVLLRRRWVSKHPIQLRSVSH